MPLKIATNALFMQVKAHGHFLLKELETRRLEAQELFLFFFIYSTNDYIQIEYAERQHWQGLETTHLEPLVSYVYGMESRMMALKDSM